MTQALQAVAKRLSVEPTQLQDIVMKTVMPNGGNGVTPEQFVSFMAVANEYRLNPLVKEIYAFPAKGGGIQPIVSIDGWLRIITGNPDFDGMEHKDIREDGKLVAIECRIYRKNTSRPVTVTEYMEECKGTSDPWKRWPIRMLRHKATIQAGRYAFGISGIIDPDEAERFRDAGVVTVVEQKPLQLPAYKEDDFEKNFPKWKSIVESGKKSAADLLATLESKATFTESQRESILNIDVEEVQEIA